MTGANYMGGKKNQAKARVKDSVGRAQKQHFGSQKLKLKLANHRSEDEPPAPKKSISDIQLAHARHNLKNLGYIAHPIRVSPSTPKSKSTLAKFSQAGSSSGSTRSSRVLEALDTLERTLSTPSRIALTTSSHVALSLRAAIAQVLSIPDLAGLSACPGQRMKRQRSSSSPCARDKSTKCQACLLPLKIAEFPLEPLYAQSPSADEEHVHLHMNISHQGSYSDFEAGLTESGAHADFGHSSDTGDSTLWATYPSTPPKPHHTVSITLQGLTEVRSPQNALNSLSGNIPSDSSVPNLFDYEDPWKALELMLGMAKTPNTPLKKRDIRKMLAEIQTPLSTPGVNDMDNEPSRIFSPRPGFQTNLLHSLLPYSTSEPSASPLSYHSPLHSHRRFDPSLHSISSHGRPNVASQRHHTSFLLHPSSRGTDIYTSSAPRRSPQPVQASHWNSPSLRYNQHRESSGLNVASTPPMQHRSSPGSYPAGSEENSPEDKLMASVLVTPRKFALPPSRKVGSAPRRYNYEYEDVPNDTEKNSSPIYPRMPDAEKPWSLVSGFNNAPNIYQDLPSPLRARYTTPTSTFSNVACQADSPADPCVSIEEPAPAALPRSMSDISSVSNSASEIGNSCISEHLSSPEMRAYYGSSQPLKRVFTSRLSTSPSVSAASLDPRAKLSTQLDMSLHKRVNLHVTHRRFSRALALSTSTVTLNRTSAKCTSQILDSEFNSGKRNIPRPAKSTPLPSFRSNSPSGNFSTQWKHVESENEAAVSRNVQGGRAETPDIQKVPRDVDGRTDGELAAADSAAFSTIDGSAREWKLDVPGNSSNEYGVGALTNSSRAMVPVLSLFEDDDLESDSD
ncbi:hypothetical protein D9757_001429 [Collybiopsis confluens]|uniref:Uncharacterized protein n=1 Tax=Collybiopsis confluens TaxID=2823264 RepID=A0A8H5HZQ4_9AGAR|nr:hypothetical protein D9757_001429 [Collybiopsis confluens]